MNLGFINNNRELLIAFAIIIVTLLLAPKIRENFIVNNLQSNQKNEQPNQKNEQTSVNWATGSVDLLNILFQEFGKPDLMDQSQDGLAIWKNTTLKQRGFCWQRLILNDSQTHPIELLYHLPLIQLQGKIGTDEALENVKLFDPSIMFDKIHQNLHIKANTMTEAIVLITLAKRVITKEISYQQAQTLMPTLIESVDQKSPNYDQNAYNRFKNELCGFQLQQNITN